MRFKLTALWDQLIRFFYTVRLIVYGMTAHEIVSYAARLRADMESLFLLITFGDLIGLPIMPPYYSLRLLPHIVPNITVWKRRVLRERDLLDEEGWDLLG